MKVNNIFFVVIGVTILASSCSSYNKVTQSSDIGSVVYVKNDDESGNLIANWVYSPNDTTVVGTGYTTKSPNSQDFAGEYIIYYTGTNIDSFNLIISKNTSINSSTFYNVVWKDINTGATDYYGTGIIMNDQLIVGWRK